MSVSALTTNTLPPQGYRSTKIAFSSLTPFQQRAIREIYRFRHAPTGQGSFITMDPRKVKLMAGYRTAIISTMQILLKIVDITPRNKAQIQQIDEELYQFINKTESALNRETKRAKAQMVEREPTTIWENISSANPSDQEILLRFYPIIKPTEDLTLAYLAKLDVTIDRILAFFELPPDIV
ncbi:MAG: hypothetical protein WC890_05405 [Candidatus Margulisiibacteriota bacterium]